MVKANSNLKRIKTNYSNDVLMAVDAVVASGEFETFSLAVNGLLRETLKGKRDGNKEGAATRV